MPSPVAMSAGALTYVSTSPKRRPKSWMPFSVRSIARATTAPVEMVSRPSSSHSWLNFASAAMSPTPQLAPQMAIVSYSGPSPAMPSISWNWRQPMAHW